MVEQVATRTVRVCVVKERIKRFIIDADGNVHHLTFGQGWLDVKLAEPQARGLEQASKGGDALRVDGFEPDNPHKSPPSPDLTALEAKERAEGKEADRLRNEAEAKEPVGAQDVAAGIQMHQAKKK